jgi:predicted amidohydrolase
MAERGVTVLANPSLIPSKYHRMWHIYVRGRSLENRIPVLSVNSLSEPFLGNSIITGMRDEGDGIVLEEENAGSQEIFYSELNYSHLPGLVRKRKDEDPGVYALPER